MLFRVSSFVTVLLIALLLVAACQTQPPTVVYIVLSPTPDTGAETADVVSVVTEEVTVEAQIGVTPTATNTVVNIDMTTTPTVPAPPTRTSIPSGFPTPVNLSIQVAEQLFEGGRMFWVEPNREIWILVVTGEGSGTWSVYSDSWIEGEPESDPNIIPPDGMLQPVRGFGKLWRTVPELREQIGWAVSREFGYVSAYEYNAGGSIDSNGNYTVGPGYHILYSLYGEQFRFNEIDSSWQLGGG
jgi:hypothetical protein